MSPESWCIIVLCHHTGSLQACEQATIAGVVGSKEQKDCFAEHTVCERFDSGRGDGLGSSS